MADRRRLIEKIWAARGRRARIMRDLLIPAEILYRSAVAARGKLYDWGVFRAQEFPVPVISVGNLTVGGTGKTPVAAWLAGQLIQRGMKPAIVLRGYGGDETIVHQRLNPAALVVAAADRVRGIREAVSKGATAVVLDDAFQHRRARRDADIVLINADAWRGKPHLLPAGPWREPLRAARRATLVVITRKIAERSTVDDVRRALSNAAPQIPVVAVYIGPSELRSTATGQSLPLQAVDGADLTAIAAIAHPDSFFKQLTELGAVVRPFSFPDHHAFTSQEARSLADAASNSDFVVCTLKDAVKLEALWPAEAGSLWYVSQRLRVEDGRQHIDRMLDGFSSSAS